MFSDPEGLTRQQIDDMGKLAQRREPSLSVPDYIGTGPFGGHAGGGTRGMTPLIGVWVDWFYLGDLDCAQLRTLYRTIIHETYHLLWNDGLSFSEAHHNRIREKANNKANAAAADIEAYAERTGLFSCGCEIFGIDFPPDLPPL